MSWTGATRPARAKQQNWRLTMSGNKSLIALSAAIALGAMGAASAAWATAGENAEGGAPVQQVVEHHSTTHNAGNSYGYVAPQKSESDAYRDDATSK
jgi:hypothetical protein